MNNENLVCIEKNQIVTSSRKVAEVFKKQHKNVLASIKEILAAENSATNFYYETTFMNRGKQYPEYFMNRDGFSLLVMGFTGKEALQWKIQYIQAFNAMEAELHNTNKQKQETIAALPDFTNPVIAARAWADAMEAKEKAEAKIEADKPKVMFADAVSVSDSDCSIGNLAKLLNQNGIKIGRNRLFKWLRDNNYLSSNINNRNIPYQQYIDNGLFRVKESCVPSDNGAAPKTFFTPFVTGKGQKYFIKKFLLEM